MKRNKQSFRDVSCLNTRRRGRERKLDGAEKQMMNSWKLPKFNRKLKVLDQKRFRKKKKIQIKLYLGTSQSNCKKMKIKIKSWKQLGKNNTLHTGRNNMNMDDIASKITETNRQTRWNL